MARERPLLAMASPRLGPLVEDVTFARLCCSRDFLATSLDLRARGVEFLSPPTERFCVIAAVLKDNSGNWFSMTQRKPAEAGKGAKSAQG